MAQSNESITRMQIYSMVSRGNLSEDTILELRAEC